jgi:hypothetical protein
MTWEAVKYVTGGASLVALIVIAIVTVLKHLIDNKARLIKESQGPEQVALVANALEFVAVNADNLTKEQQYTLALEQIRQRAERFKQVICLVAFICVLCATLCIVAFTQQRQNLGDPHGRANAIAKEQLNAINLIHGRYLAAKDEGLSVTNEVLSSAPAAAKKLESLKDTDLSTDFCVVKYSYRAFALAMAAKFAKGEIQLNYARDSIASAETALKLIDELRNSKGTDTNSHRWLDDDKEQERVLYYLAMCHGIEESAANETTHTSSKAVLFTLAKMNLAYLTLHNPSQNEFLRISWQELKQEKKL